MESSVVPWTLDGLDLGSDVLELGAGYGAATDLLRGRARRLTCIEIDPSLAERLRRRFPDPNITVLCEDASKMPVQGASFDGAVCFTMLHHLPSAAKQDRLLAEVARVLRPGGLFAGSDSTDGPIFRLFHLFDTLTVVEPRAFSDRLKAAGFEAIQVDANRDAFRFRARKPADAVLS